MVQKPAESGRSLPGLIRRDRAQTGLDLSDASDKQLDLEHFIANQICSAYELLTRLRLQYAVPLLC